MGDNGRGSVRIPAVSLYLKGKYHVLLLIARLLKHRRDIRFTRPPGMCDDIPTAANEERRTEDSCTSRADLLAGELAPEEHERLLSILLLRRIHDLRDFGVLVRRDTLSLDAVVVKHIAVFLHFCQSFLSYKKISCYLYYR